MNISNEDLKRLIEFATPLTVSAAFPLEDGRHCLAFDLEMEIELFNVGTALHHCIEDKALLEHMEDSVEILIGQGVTICWPGVTAPNWPV